MIEFTLAEVAEYYRVRLPILNQRGAQWRGPCPIHQGKRDSFAVDPKSGRWNCHATCGRVGDILALEEALSSADFKAAKAEVFRIVGRPDRLNGNNGPLGLARGRIAATYDYTNEDGRLLYQAVRIDPKDFKQRKPDGNGGWVWNLKGVRLVLYHLPSLLRRSTETVFICEGEKDVHSLEALGLLATCNPMGAGKWRTEYSEAIRGRPVVLLPDNDPPTDDDGKPHYRGQKHAAWVAADLLRVRCEVRIVEIPKGKDVSEWLASGGTLGELRALLGAQHPLTMEALEAWQLRWERTEAKQAADRQPVSPGPNSQLFHLTDEAVIYADPDPDKEPLPICGRLEVAALTRDAKGNSWGRLLRWVDSEGRVHEWAMPMSLLAGDCSECRARLLDGGLFIAPGRKQRDLLTVYLQTAKIDVRVLCVAQIGWHQNSFVLPGETIGPGGTEAMLFQPPFETEHYLNVSGTSEEWQKHIGRFCSGNSRLMLAVSCAFAGPVLSLVNEESGGVHLMGTTSTGKSTALLVGGSVLGGGGRNGFVRSFRATANGLEAIAELHNDLALFLDELVQMDPKEAAETVYLLGNGNGKARMSRNIGSRRNLNWSLLFVSAGELTLADHVQTAGKRARGGAEVRLLNIEADAGVGLGLFENLHGTASPDVFARQLKEAVGRYYGAPLRTYLELVTSKRATVELALRSFQADFLKNRVPTGATGEVFRAAQRFALIAAAGELATDARITGWKAGEATEAAARCFTSWIDARGTTRASDTEAAINQVRRFIGVHGASRFQSVKARCDNQGNIIRERIIDRAGFRVDGEYGEVSEYLILPTVFQRDVCEGFDYRAVARALLQRGYLDCESPHLTKKPRLPEVGLVRVYVIKSSILGE